MQNRWWTIEGAAQTFQLCWIADE